MSHLEREHARKVADAAQERSIRLRLSKGKKLEELDDFDQRFLAQNPFITAQLKADFFPEQYTLFDLKSVADALPAFAELSSTEKEKAYKKLDQISAFARRVHAYVREHGLSEEEIGQKSYEIIIQWEDELPTTDRHWGFNLATGRMSPDQVVFYAIPES